MLVLQYVFNFLLLGNAFRKWDTQETLLADWVGHQLSWILSEDFPEKKGGKGGNPAPPYSLPSLMSLLVADRPQEQKVLVGSYVDAGPVFVFNLS